MPGFAFMASPFYTGKVSIMQINPINPLDIFRVNLYYLSLPTIVNYIHLFRILVARLSYVRHKSDAPNIDRST